MENTTLVIMAAGIGSRFGGGVKQLTSFGPSGEIIMDYSIYDALEAGFNKVVFVIRKNMFEDFKQIIGERIAKQVPVEYAFQELEDIPEGFLVPPERKKPWGTGQAILACKGIVKEPFAVINADDYYGKDAFRKVHDYLVNAGEAQQGVYQFCMAGFVLENTLSEHGGVTRGLCRIGENGELSAIRETKNIIKTESGAAVSLPDGTQQSLDAKSLVSMNFWGFTPDFIDELEQGFAKFLSELGDCTLTGEYLLPTIVDGLIQEKRVKLTVLPSRDKWFGVTFREDVPYVKQAFLDLVQDGVYPEKLF
ncbi:MAG: nucleotidyltransferase [Lachnospiraceae bacterium]|nr:nucleotidyltransferase [Lachnospiraceae bacterium]